VFNIKTLKAHQGCAYQKFMYHGILALLPIYLDEFSVVYSLNNEMLKEYKSFTDTKFIQMLKNEIGEVFRRYFLNNKSPILPFKHED